MNELMNFNYKNKPISVFSDDGQQEWFSAKEVCDALEIKNNRDAVAKLDEDEKLMSVISTSGQRRSMWFVNEPGLYQLAFVSRTEQSKMFKRWLAHVVIPAIRNRNGCSTDKELLDLLDRSKHALRFLTDENMHLRKENRQYEQILSLQEQLAKKNTPLTVTEKETVLSLKDSLAPKAIAGILNRPSDSAVRSFLKTCKEEAQK